MASFRKTSEERREDWKAAQERNDQPRITGMSYKDKMTSLVYLNIPYDNRDIAKRHGARWDAIAKKWYVRGMVPATLTKYRAKLR